MCTPDPQTGAPLTVKMWAYSNAEEVELLLNGKPLGSSGSSSGRKQMPKYGHVEWDVPFQPGTIEVRGYIGGKQVLD